MIHTRGGVCCDSPDSTLMAGCMHVALSPRRSVVQKPNPSHVLETRWWRQGKRDKSCPGGGPALERIPRHNIYRAKARRHEKRQPSSKSYVVKCMATLIARGPSLRLKSFAINHLGCSEIPGRLSWSLASPPIHHCPMVNLPPTCSGSCGPCPAL